MACIFFILLFCNFNSFHSSKIRFTRDRINRRSIKSRFEMGKIRFIHSDLAKPKKVSKWWWEDSFRRQIYKSTTNNTKGSTDVQITITITGRSTGSSTKKMISFSTRRPDNFRYCTLPSVTTRLVCCCLCVLLFVILSVGSQQGLFVLRGWRWRWRRIRIDNSG